MFANLSLLMLLLLLVTNYPQPTSLYPLQDDILIDLRQIHEFPSPTSINTSIWMHQFNLTLPGTHDAASFTLILDLSSDSTGNPVFDALVKLAGQLGIPLQDVIIPWFKLQNRSLYGQAENGMRHFDIRAAFNRMDWYSYHSELGLPIYTHLSALNEY